MIVVSRFRVPEQAQETFADLAGTALAAYAARPGYVHGRLARNLDDPTLWLLTMTWADVGSYRRALSAYDVRVGVAAVMGYLIDEPTAYEVVEPGGETNEQRPRSLD